MVKHTQTIRQQFADKLFEYVKTILWGWYLNLVSSIFYQIIIFSSNDRPSRTTKNVFYFIQKALFVLQDIQIFVIYSLLFHTFQIQKGKWK